MGVSYYECDGCGRKFADCSWNAAWCDCDGRFCSKECAQKQDDEDEEGFTTCVLCRIEVVRDEDLLSFLLKRADLTREQAVELYRDKNKP